MTTLLVLNSFDFDSFELFVVQTETEMRMSSYEGGLFRLVRSFYLVSQSVQSTVCYCMELESQGT